MVAGTSAGQNSTLTDDEQRALFFQHKRKYEVALGAFKAAQAEMKHCGKRAKADLGDGAVDQIKDAIALGTPEGVAAHREKLSRGFQVARWMGMAVGTQDDLFSVDRRPQTEIAYNLGFEHGAAGDSRRCPENYAPSSPEGQAYFKGYDKGQESIFNIKEKRGDDLLRPEGGGKSPEPDEDDEGDGGPDTVH